MSRPIRAYIDADAARRNLQRVRAMAGQSKVMAVVKANGYGHGVERIAKALSEADAFAVASIDEALDLRRAAIDHPIVLLEGVFTYEEFLLVAQERLGVVLHSWQQLEMLEAAQLSQPIVIWLKVDTGMHRLGFSPHEVDAVWQRLHALSDRIASVGLMTHFAAADEVNSTLTELQLSRFNAVRQSLPALLPTSMANSAAIVHFTQAHGDWVRPGVMLYGVSPCTLSADDLGLWPVMTLVSRVIAVKTVLAGECIGYGGRWCVPTDTRIAIVAVGYGDGYPRHAPSGTQVLVNGSLAPLVGRVSMDMITIDISDLGDVQVDDPVVLWGVGLPVEQLALQAGTIAYELLCGVTKRVPCIEGRPESEWFMARPR
jgi:alanine racemase